MANAIQRKIALMGYPCVGSLFPEIFKDPSHFFSIIRMRGIENLNTLKKLVNERLSK